MVVERQGLGDTEKDVDTCTNVIFYTQKESMVFPMLMFTSLTNAQQYCIQIHCTVF
jgi:hypothetical protein